MNITTQGKKLIFSWLCYADAHVTHTSNNVMSLVLTRPFWVELFYAWIFSCDSWVRLACDLNLFLFSLCSLPNSDKCRQRRRNQVTTEWDLDHPFSWRIYDRQTAKVSFWLPREWCLFVWFFVKITLFKCHRELRKSHWSARWIALVFRYWVWVVLSFAILHFFAYIVLKLLVTWPELRRVKFNSLAMEIIALAIAFDNREFIHGQRIPRILAFLTGTCLSAILVNNLFQVETAESTSSLFLLLLLFYHRQQQVLQWKVPSTPSSTGSWVVITAPWKTLLKGLCPAEGELVSIWT